MVKFKRLRLFREAHDESDQAGWRLPFLTVAIEFMIGKMPVDLRFIQRCKSNDRNAARTDISPQSECGLKTVAVRH